MTYMLFLWLATAAPDAFAAPILAWDITGGTVSSPGGVPRANGARFSVSEPSETSALGMFDHGADGLQQDHVVTLWTDGGVMLAQATVTNLGTTHSSIDSNGQWIFQSIESIVLDPGIYRVAVGYTVVGGDEARSQTTVVTELGANYIEQAFTNTGMGDTTFPGLENSNPVFGANMLIGVVPEPSTALLLASGHVCAVPSVRSIIMTG